ncbi:MAG: hypothetical protein FWD23_19115, partial [Oscillospiraceae bacterium]|nr:hypothetical protein [Oscillospiraceae bacterium]
DKLREKVAAGVITEETADEIIERIEKGLENFTDFDFKFDFDFDFDRPESFKTPWRGGHNESNRHNRHNGNKKDFGNEKTQSFETQTASI